MERILKLKTGHEYVITGEVGKYYICEDGTHFRKANPDIDEIKNVKQTKEEKWEDIPAEDPTLKQIEKDKPKRTTKKASKKGE